MEIRLFKNENEAYELLPLGKPKLARAGELEICLVRFEGKIYAFENACPHMGEKLHRGRVNYLAEIVCPLHSYRFHMQMGEESEGRCPSLRTYPIMLKPEGLYIAVD